MERITATPIVAPATVTGVDLTLDRSTAIALAALVGCFGLEVETHGLHSALMDALGLESGSKAGPEFEMRRGEARKAIRQRAMSNALSDL